MINITGILFLFLCFRIFRLLIRMKQPVIFPVTEEDLQEIRIQPKKSVELPIINQQKTGLLWLGLTLLFLLILVVFDLLSTSKDLSYAVIPLLVLFTFNQVWNLFAIVENGVLCGGRFVSWKNIQSYHFEGIDQNHRFYGYSPEVNSGYELWITTKFSEVSCIVTSEAVKEKLAGILDGHVS
ncbi:hypothetical protein M3152_14700 [Sporosarcina luteola]|uniref:hypothetical protein n=1 Tax=Sporosarcina luteola TaxID=582850 RepID=UPI00204005D3|nr:hypothetical protein [Sporosarcina luteola]MCM3638950.1 hypothetical protein [Sporosarcina luteola]